MTTSLEISMISASDYKSRHTQPECGYALEPPRWTEYSIHTMDPDNLELTFEFFEVRLISMWPLIAQFTDKLYYLASCNCLNQITGRLECTRCRRRCSSRTRGHRLPPLLILLRERQGQRSSHTSNNGTKLQTDNRESQRLKHNPKASHSSLLFFYYLVTQCFSCFSWLPGDPAHPGTPVWHEFLFRKALEEEKRNRRWSQRSWKLACSKVSDE